MDNIKQLLKMTLLKKMEKINWKQLEEFRTQPLAVELNASRNVISQYLNEYVEDGFLLKINVRPIIFLVKEKCSKNPQYLKVEYQTIEDLMNDINSANQHSTAFTKLIGHKGSLNSIIQHCKSAITYPKSGLPILVLGPTGVGKSLIAQTMYNYGLEKTIFTEKSRFITVNCSEYANNPEFFLTNLFGCKKGAYTGADKDREGLISLADGGMLFLDEVHCLSSECQEKLFLFMDKGIYHMVGDNEKWYEASEHLVFATTENPQIALLKTLYRRIPIVTHIPSLSERPQQEKRELLTYILKQEAQQIDTDIQISQRLYKILINYDYPENVGQLVNCIKACVANAYVDLKNKHQNLMIDIQNLPDSMIEQCDREGFFTTFTDLTMMTLDELSKIQQQELKLYAFNKDLLTIYDGSPFEIIYNRSKRRLNQYMDSVCFKENSQTSIKELLYHSVIETVCQRLMKKYSVSFANNEILNLTKLYNDYMINSGSCDSILNQNAGLVDEFIQKFTSYDPDAVAMASDFVSQMKGLLNQDMNALMFLNAILYLKVLSTRIQERETRCMILSHGYSTASSLATSVNYMMEDDIFDAIDMPMDVSITSIVKKLNEYIGSQNNLRDLIILVDMGSLEDIYNRIKVVDKINLVIINNVTIKLALDVAVKVHQNMPIKKIAESIHHEDYLNKTVFIENRQKEKAILTVCATGIATAEKISRLLIDSFPRSLNCKVIEYGYASLIEGGKNAAIFEKYDVQFIIGTMDPCVKGITFISIEDMIDKQKISRVRELMGTFLNEEELELFAQNIIKNFSLQNLLDYLTILNPKKIINYVESIIESLQRDLSLTMQSNTIVGLYLHISCLIERLITDKYITNYDNLKIFEAHEQDFIKIVKKAFNELEKHYCVEIPVSEIAYIYDYIYRLSSVEGNRQSVEDSLFN